jgi:hypothetical protein
VLEYRKPWKRQPQEATEVDWENPFARNLWAALLPYDRVRDASQQNSLTNGSTETVDVIKDGLARKYTRNSFNVRHTVLSGSSKTGANGWTFYVRGVLTNTTSAGLVDSNNNNRLRIMSGTPDLYISSGARLTSSVTLSAGQEFEIVAWGSSAAGYNLLVNGTLNTSAGGWGDFGTLTGLGGSSGDGTLNCSISLFLAWNEIKSRLEIDALRTNPWQLFAPRHIWVPPPRIITPGKVVEYRKPWTRQPQGATEPASDVEVLYFAPTNQDLRSKVLGVFSSPTAARNIVTPAGVAAQIAGFNDRISIKSSLPVAFLQGARVSIAGLITANTSGTSRTYFLNNRGSTTASSDRRGAFSINVLPSSHTVRLTVNGNTSNTVADLFSLELNKVMFLEIVCRPDGYDYHSNYGSGFVSVADGIPESVSSIPPGELTFGQSPSLIEPGHSAAALLHVGYSRKPRGDSYPWQLFAPRSIWVPVSAGGGPAPVTATTSLSAAVQAAQAATTSLAAAIQAAQSATSSIDSAIQEQKAASASVNSSIQAARTAQAALDAALQIGASYTASINSAIQFSDAKTASLNAYIQAGFTASASLSAAIQALSTGNASLDAVIQQALSGAASVNAAIQAQNAASASVSGAILASQSNSASVNAAIQRALSLTATITAAVQVAGSASVSLNGYIQAGSEVSAQINAAIQEILSASATISAVIALSGSVTASISAAIQVEQSVSVAIGATIQELRASAASLNAYITDPSLIISNSVWWMYDMPVNDLTYEMPVNDLTYEL